MNWLALGSIYGFLGVAFGAFGAHALKDRLDAYSLDVWRTAVQYQLWHALALVALGVLAQVPSAQTISARANGAGWAFTIGVLIFSGTLYLLALSGIKWLGAITPLGGLSLLVGWVWLAWASYV